jgi:cell division protease FtsH
MALGLTQQIPVEDRHSYNRRYLNNNLVILYGGRVAEEIVMDEMTTGASNDIEKATELARKMVCEWGMSDSMGPVTYSTPNEEVFLGMDITQRREYSEATAGSIDAEVRNILSGAYKKARALLNEHLAILHKMAAALLEKEVLDNTDIQKLLREGGVEPPAVPEPAPVPA